MYFYSKHHYLTTCKYCPLPCKFCFHTLSVQIENNELSTTISGAYLRETTDKMT